MADVSGLSIRELKALLNGRGVSIADCTEKADLVARARATAHLPSSNSSSPGKVPASQAAEASKPIDPFVESILALPPRQYYALLGVASDAKADALKKAYRHLALRLHPDKCRARGADEAFKRISAAFAVLSDSRQRAAHDFSGGDSSAAAAASASSSSGSAGAPGPFYGRRHAGGFGDKDAEDLFRAFFGRDEDVFGAGAGSAASGGGGAGSAVAGFDGSALAHRATRALALGQRLMKTFKENPWALVTLLSGLASLVSVFESFISIFGRWLAVVVPVAAVGIATCPPQQRRTLAIALGMLLCSGLVF